MMTGFSPGSIPQLPRGVRLHHDTIRNTHVLLAPERAFDLDPIALEILNLVDGRRSIREIASNLATRYDADCAVIQADVIEMLNNLSEKRIVGALNSKADLKP